MTVNVRPSQKLQKTKDSLVGENFCIIYSVGVHGREGGHGSVTTPRQGGEGGIPAWLSKTALSHSLYIHRRVLFLRDWIVRISARATAWAWHKGGGFDGLSFGYIFWEGTM